MESVGEREMVSSLTTWTMIFFEFCIECMQYAQVYFCHRTDSE